ncbi:MAG: ParB N-terminal domain-containing protein [Nitrospina sp.]|nr:ParB N-terminal domain-containing protein [Nitrospina sp.]MBT6601083.1 ParB N-terminal domain-containing protein [Nitrospina sp.]
MIKNNQTCIFKSILIDKIDVDDQLTSFSFDIPVDSLKKSIEELGIIHPVTLTQVDNRFRIICGHKRIQIFSQLKINKIPAIILRPAPSEESMMMLNLSENQFCHYYSDIEKGAILSKLYAVKIPEIRIIEKYMPMLDLEKSKKLLSDYLSANELTTGLKTLLHEMNVPLRVYSIFSNWDVESSDAAEIFFSVLRPGVNKWRDLLEWVHEISIRDGIRPSSIFELPELKSILNQNDLAPNIRYDQIRKIFHSRRYPVLSDLRIRIARSIDALKLDDKTRVLVQDSFESDKIIIEMNFRTKAEFVNQLEKLVRASDSEALEELICIFKDP